MCRFVRAVATVIESFKEDALGNRYSHGKSGFPLTELRDLHWSLVSIVNRLPCLGEIDNAPHITVDPIPVDNTILFQVNDSTFIKG